LEIERELMRQFGPVIGGSELRKALGFRSAVTFRRAIRQGKLAVKVFELEGRRGKFALTADVARWLARVSNVSTPRVSLILVAEVPSTTRGRFEM
jgi:hypothetical protein